MQYSNASVVGANMQSDMIKYMKKYGSNYVESRMSVQNKRSNEHCSMDLVSLYLKWFIWIWAAAARQSLMIWTIISLRTKLSYYLNKHVKFKKKKIKVALIDLFEKARKNDILY